MKCAPCVVHWPNFLQNQHLHIAVKLHLSNTESASTFFPLVAEKLADEADCVRALETCLRGLSHSQRLWCGLLHWKLCTPQTLLQQSSRLQTEDMQMITLQSNPALSNLCVARKPSLFLNKLLYFIPYPAEGFLTVLSITSS